MDINALIAKVAAARLKFDLAVATRSHAQDLQDQADAELGAATDELNEAIKAQVIAINSK